MEIELIKKDDQFKKISFLKEQEKSKYYETQNNMLSIQIVEKNKELTK